MGFKNLSNVKFAEPQQDSETISKLHSLAKFSMLETFEPSYYGSIQDHALAGLKKHLEIYHELPEEYDLMFTEEGLNKYFLDCHKVIAAMFLTHSGVKEEIIFQILDTVQVNRVFLYFLNMFNENFLQLTQLTFTKAQVRNIFYKFLAKLEREWVPTHIANFTVKYRNKLQSLFALLRVKRRHLSEFWKEAMDFLFMNKSERKTWTQRAFYEVSELRTKRTITALKNTKNVPFSNYLGFAWKILKEKGRTDEEIKEYLYSRTDLMTNNEIKRYLRQLQEADQLETKEAKEKIQKRVQKAPSDIFSLLTALRVLKNEVKELTLDTMELKIKKLIEEIKGHFKDKNVGIAVDVSRNTIGYETDHLTMRRTTDKNLLSGFILAHISKLQAITLFNESHVTGNYTDVSIKEFLNEIITIEGDGGSAPGKVLRVLTKLHYDMLIMISDFNENIPMRGYLQVKLPEIAKEFKKPIFLLQTELDISEISALESVINENKLDNVYLLPIKKLEHLISVIETIELDEEIKEMIKKVLKQKKKKAPLIYS